MYVRVHYTNFPDVFYTLFESAFALVLSQFLFVSVYPKKWTAAVEDGPVLSEIGIVKVYSCGQAG